MLCFGFWPPRVRNEIRVSHMVNNHCLLNKPVNGILLHALGYYILYLVESRGYPYKVIMLHEVFFDAQNTFALFLVSFEAYEDERVPFYPVDLLSSPAHRSEHRLLF